MDKPMPTERHFIDPVAFFGALILAPLLVTALTFWIAYIPVAALMLGGPVYLLLGTPVLLWHLSRNAPHPADIAGLAMATVAVVAGCVLVLTIISAPVAEAKLLLLLTIPGLIFAPLWGATFGWLYIRLRRDFFTITA